MTLTTPALFDRAIQPRLGRLVSYIGTAVLVFALRTPCLGTQFATETVYSDAYANPSYDIAQDRQGYAHIAYARGSSPTLFYARKTQTQWQTESISGPWSNVLNVSLKLGADGQPHSLYNSFPPPPSSQVPLRYSYKRDGVWSSEVITLTGRAMALELDGTSIPHVVYTDAVGNAYRIKYASKVAATWMAETVWIGPDWWGNYGTALGLTSTAQPQVVTAAFDLDTYGTFVKYFSKATGAWTTETIDEEEFGSYVLWPRVAVDSMDSPHVVYQFSKADEPDRRSELRYAKKNGGSWSTEVAVVDYVAGLGPPDIRVDPAGNVHLSFERSMPGLREVMYARKVGGSWTLESAGEVVNSNGRQCELEIGPSGSPGILVLDQGEGELKHIAAPRVYRQVITSALGGEPPPVGSSCTASIDSCVVIVTPSSAGCDGLPAYLTTENIVYVVCSGTPCVPVPNVPLEIMLQPILDSGGHCHGDETRPVGFMVADQYNTGADGLGCVVTHTWPEVAGGLNVVFYSTDPAGPYYHCRDTVATYCVVHEPLLELPENPALYNRVGGGSPDAARHPDHHHGEVEMLTGLSNVAQDYLAARPGSSPLNYNDISLPWGGLFDVVTNGIPRPPDWTPPHCGHRFGRTCDIRTYDLSSNERQTLLSVLTLRGFKVYKHSGHFHATLMAAQPIASRRVMRASDSAVLDSQLKSAHSAYRWDESDILRNASLTEHAIGGTTASVVVNASVSIDSTTGMWTYAYTILSDSTSAGVVDLFAIRGVLEPLNVTAPGGWSAYYGYAVDPLSQVWSVYEAGAPPEGWVDDGSNTYPSAYGVGPAQVLGGFVFNSPDPPESVDYFIKVWSEIPDSEEETLTPPTLWEEGVVGRTVGPVTTTGVVDRGPNDGTNSDSENWRVFPNPSSGKVEIAYSLPAESTVDLMVYTAGGRRARRVASGVVGPGSMTAVWDGRDDEGREVPAGIYFLLLRSSSGLQLTERVVIVR